MEDSSSSSSCRRRRVLAADRLGDLPDFLLHEVLSCLGSRQVVQTSVLSRRWRHLWRHVPCIDLDHRDFDLDQWATFEAFADHMLDLRRAAEETPPLHAFRLHLAQADTASSWSWKARSAIPPNSSWIRRGLERLPSAVHIRGCFDSYTTWPDTAAGSRVTRLRLLQVDLPDGFGQRIGERCPVIEELHLENCRSYELRGIASPTLRSLTVAAHLNSFSPGELVVAAPRLASLHLDGVQNNGWVVVDLESISAAAQAGEEAVLGSLVAASICVQETRFYHDTQSSKQRKRHFWSSIHSLLRRAPNLTNLQLQGFTTTTAFIDEKFGEFPMLQRLTTLLLIEANFNFKALTTILANTPNLEKLRLHLCTVDQPSSSKSTAADEVARRNLVCNKTLKSVEIKGGNEFRLRHFLLKKFRTKSNS